jgi:hypothetical protein
MFIDKTKFEHLGTLTNTGNTDVVFNFPQRVQVKRIVLIATTASTAAGTITVKKNGTSVGTFANAAVSAVHKAQYADVGSVDPDGAAGADGSTVYKGGETFIQFEPGDYLTLTPANTASTGVYEAYVEYIPEGLNEAEVATKNAFTAA